MLQSKLFCKTKKQAPKTAKALSHKFLVRGDFIDQLASGIYSFLPLGWRVHKKIESIIREEMNKICGQEIFLPALQPQKIWEETKRWENIDPPLFKLKDRHQRELVLGPTHEEVITDLARRRVKSYKDLPFSLYQIQNKFRNEMRATGGLLRTREFIMKDLYSFHSSEKDLSSYYEKVKKAYSNIFKRCGLKVVCVEADSGTIGGALSHEFMVLSDTGEDWIFTCSKCNYGANIEKVGEIKICPNCKGKIEKKRSIEAGHTFNLGTKYSKAMEASFVDEEGSSKSIIMGCYGIGLGRLMATVVEVNNDSNGIIWPREIAPFTIHLIPIGLSGASGKIVLKETKEIYKKLKESKIEVLYDDRIDKTPGEKFAEADLIGIPYRVVVSEKTSAKNCVEVKERAKERVKLVKINKVLDYLNLV
ncbi:proline--tRNA ligase [Patescibacteria group bacterium]|nr:proline--tRNA ligase [Patescibacteria group bacterium]